jgi:DNA-binding transcriptional ArsR family regulator
MRVVVRVDTYCVLSCLSAIFYHMVEYLSIGSSAARQLDRVYGAIADPTRRAILGILAGGEVNVGTLAGRFPISFNGVSKHVKVLEQAGLVRRSVRGREHWLRLRPQPLRDASRWLEHYREFWETRLDALEDFLVQQKDRPGAKGRHRGGRSAR